MFLKGIIILIFQICMLVIPPIFYNIEPIKRLELLLYVFFILNLKC